MCILSLVLHGNMMEAYKGEGSTLVALGGRISLVMFIGFTVFSLLGLTIIRKYNNLDYKLWKNLHRFMLLPFLIGCYHSLNNGYIRIANLSLYGVWMTVLILSGLILAIYSTIFYEFFAFRKKGKILEVKRLNNDIVEIVIEKPFEKIKVGQFGFFKFYGGKIKKESHPFTFSEIGEDFIKISVKASGDFTKKLYNNITINHFVAIDGPYGAFDYSKASTKQLWIAGGIGVTPFISFVNSDIPEEYNIKFYYVYKNNDDSVYKNDIMDKIGSNIEYYPVSTKENGRPDFLKIISKYKPDDIFICGPVKMKESIVMESRKMGYSKKSIHFERFYF